ncbi:MAG TPA: alpha/beta hydrolase [Thermoleophilaceae bacterium]|jgi:pimeloyl-ACP methyl ester carboxylesterase
MALAMPELDGVEHHYEQVGDLRMHYAEAGDPAAPVVVLQHGWPENWWAWRDLIGPLSERYRVICPDLRGLGWTEAPAHGYEKPRLAADVVGLLDRLGIERARYVGHDWGGFCGFLACFEHPERFERFMPLSIPHPWAPDERPSPSRLARLWYMAVIAAPLLGPLAVGRLGFPVQILRKSRVAGDWPEGALELYGEAVGRPAYTSASVQYYRSFLTREMGPLAKGAYNDKRLTVPTLLLVGSSDPVAQIDEVYRQKADDMTVEVVEGAGHWLPEEKPEAVLERALEFLA